MNKKDNLSPKERIFVKAYLKHKFNATRAAIVAGYAPDSAAESGCENLRKSNIKKAIYKQLEKIEQKIDVGIENVINELKVIAFSDIQHYIDIDPDTGAIRAKGFEDMPPNASRAIEAMTENRIIKESVDGKQVTVHDRRGFRLHSKIQALEMLGKYLRMWENQGEERTDRLDEVVKAMQAGIAQIKHES